MRLVATVVNAAQGGLTPVFSGGTSLSKGYGLIQSFSEDLDFKVLLPEVDIGRAERRTYRTAVIEPIRADDRWTLQDDDVTVANESRFFCCHVGYPTTAVIAPVLRPRLKLEVTLASPAFPTEERQLRSFVAQAMGQDAEVPRIGCVALAETAADKLSALTWRILDPETRQDRTLIRHVHDLAALEPHVREHPGFPELLRRLLDADATRGEAEPNVAALSPARRLTGALDILVTDQEHATNYEDFVGAMCYGGDGETPTFGDALEATRRLVQRLI